MQCLPQAEDWFSGRTSEQRTKLGFRIQHYSGQKEKENASTPVLNRQTPPRTSLSAPEAVNWAFALPLE